MAGDAVPALERLLEAERAAIRSGDFAGLERLAAEAERMAGRLGAEAGPAALQRLRNRAEANRRLLAAAIRGVEAARARLEVIMSGGLSTYDDRGRTQALSGPSRAVERRA